VDRGLQRAVPNARQALLLPLTIADQHTRYLLACRGRLSTQTVTARPVFEWAFREYGLPRAIRTDNGVPFATRAIHGLSYLNVWWMRLGILHQRICASTPRFPQVVNR
jgi:putative transposase